MAAVAVDPPHVIKREVLLVDHVGVPVGGAPGFVLGPITGEVLDVGCVRRPSLPGGVGYVHVHVARVAGVLQLDQVGAIGSIPSWLEGDLLDKDVVIACWSRRKPRCLLALAWAC